MLKIWNVSLMLATGTLAIVGTFLVRSGILDSIHAFVEQGNAIAWAFTALIAVMLRGSIGLVVSRRATAAPASTGSSRCSRARPSSWATTSCSSRWPSSSSGARSSR